jgi:hypothetical protein
MMPVGRRGQVEAFANPKRRAYWLKTLHQWHWISAAVSLAAMLLFSATGLTLNHAARIEAKPQVATRTAMLPADVRIAFDKAPTKGRAALPVPVADWLLAQWHVEVRALDAEWSDGEAYVSLPRPGGDAWISIDTATGEATWEVTDRGWIAWANDLHKGRNTGPLWAWFIDLFAIACVLFSLTGLLLLWLHGRQRPMTWPLVGLGLLLPLLIMLLFIH